MTDAHPPIPRSVALPIAEAIRDNLLRQKVAVRAEVAGSLRRGRAEVHDAEVVIELPTVRHQTLDREVKNIVPAGVQGRLDRALLENEWSSGPLGFVVDKAMLPFARPAWGERYRKLDIELRDATHLQLDLFVVHPPAEYAPILAVRTGSAKFGEAVVTRLHRYGLQLKDGRVIQQASGTHIICPDEATYFGLAHLPPLPPEQREMTLPSTAALFEAP